MISLIAAVDENYGIGKNNQLLCHLPADLKYFKNMTMGKPIIMGRKTFESIGKPLPGRCNIVISRHGVKMDGLFNVNSLTSALAVPTESDEIMVIGGATIYQQAMPYASRIYLTKIHHQFEPDVYFPAFDKTGWNCIETTFRPKDEKNEYDLTFYIYERAPITL